MVDGYRTRVYDCDTLTVESKSHKFKVRLVGRGAPEISRKKTDPGRQFRPQAKVHLPKLVLNKTINLESCGLDRSANSFTLSNY